MSVTLALWGPSYQHRKLETMTTQHEPTLTVFRNGTPIFTSYGKWLYPLFELEAYQQFPLMTCESYTTYVGGRLSEHFDHPLLSFDATCTIRTDTIPGGKQVHVAVQA
jgi:hypothetical protein